jgi:hypothetical protein
LREAIWCFFWIDFRAFVMHRDSALNTVVRGFHKYEIWRLSNTATAWLGKRWQRAPRLLEIDLTYKCNMRCNDCNRSVTQAPENAQITRARMAEHIASWIARDYRWDRVRLLGGEPTLHPDFLEIVEDLRAYRKEHAPRLKIEVITNGFGARVNAIIDTIPADIIVVNTRKTSNNQPVHQTFNRAPCDFTEHERSDFSNGCFVTEFSGTGLTPTGYYHCAVAGGIDRVFGLNIGRESLPDTEDEMRKEMEALCRYCGHFTAQMQAVPQSERMSVSWKNAYSAWRARRLASGSAQADDVSSEDEDAPLLG